MSSNDPSRVGPLVMTVPCFSGAEWALASLPGLAGWRTATMRLPEGAATLEASADAVLEAVSGVERFVLVGDSFGAVVALTVALRQPPGLVGLVLSGGFAADPVPRWKTAAGSAARFVPDPVYRQAVLRFHATQLASRFDATAEVPHRREDYRRLFMENTPRRSYAGRVRAVAGFDVRARLHEVSVPTLLLTPADDRLIGAAAAGALREGIPNAREVVLPQTGHMFRFTHPALYSEAIAEFLRELAPAAV